MCDELTDDHLSKENEVPKCVPQHRHLGTNGIDYLQRVNPATGESLGTMLYSIEGPAHYPYLLSSKNQNHSIMSVIPFNVSTPGL